MMNGAEYHRLQAGISINELSRRSGVACLTLRQMLYGEIENMMTVSFMKVAKTLGVSIDDLIHPHNAASGM